LFVSRITQNHSTDFHKIQWKVARGARKKRLDFVDNLDYVNGGRVRVIMSFDVTRHTQQALVRLCFTRRVFNGNYRLLLCPGGGICDLLSAILVSIGHRSAPLTDWFQRSGCCMQSSYR